MIDIEKQIEYWRSGALNDIDTAVLLIKNNKILHGLFFCHLVIEKIIKAHVVKDTKQVPPKSHDLLYLLRKTNLDLNQKHLEFFGLMMRYQLEGRYPYHFPVPPTKEKAKTYLKLTKEILSCLKEKL
ncbi:MAG: HEPN domain-containing protein [Bacteroidales bacterium]|nr:HEPN domain-containing protein [Bacteroidales bacterium]